MYLYLYCCFLENICYVFVILNSNFPFTFYITSQPYYDAVLKYVYGYVCIIFIYRLKNYEKIIYIIGLDVWLWFIYFLFISLIIKTCRYWGVSIICLYIVKYTIYIHLVGIRQRLYTLLTDFCQAQPQIQLGWVSLNFEISSIPPPRAGTREAS